MRLITTKYTDFLDLRINENLNQAKKYLKDKFIRTTSIMKVIPNTVISNSYDAIDKDSGDVLNINDLTEEQKSKVLELIKTTKLTDVDLKGVENNPLFLSVKKMLGDKVGFTYLFTYLAMEEKIPLDELKTLFKHIIDFKDSLDKLRRPISNYIDKSIPNNGEQLGDDLENISRARKAQKFVNEFDSDLKAEYRNSAPALKKRIEDIAFAFDELGKDVNGTDDEKMKIRLSTQKRFFSKIKRYKALNSLINGAELFLKSESNSSSSKFYNQIEKCNELYGKFGARIVFDDDNILILELLSFPACKMLCSNTSWCISTSDHYWNSYVGGDSVFTRQYAIYNYNLSPTDNNSIIGITINSDKSIRACHAKNDSGISSSCKSIFNSFESKAGLPKNTIWDLLEPMSESDKKKKQLRIIANKEIIKPNKTMSEIKKYVLEDGADVNTNNCVVLQNAVKESNLEKVEFLLKIGANPNLNKEIIENCKSDPKEDKDSPKNKKNFEIIKILIENGGKITNNVYKNFNSDYDAIEFFLKKGYHPDGVEDNGKKSYNPIRTAVKSDRLDIVKLLLKYGSTAFSDPERVVASRVPFEYCKYDIINYLFEEGICVNNWDENLKFVVNNYDFPKADKTKMVDFILKYISEKKVTIKNNGSLILSTIENDKNKDYDPAKMKALKESKEDLRDNKDFLSIVRTWCYNCINKDI